MIRPMGVFADWDISRGTWSPWYSNYYNQQTMQPTPPPVISPINDLLSKAAAAKANAPTLASLFPSMGQGLLGGYNQMPGNFTGQWGAGRFLSPNASQFGNPAQPIGGFAPNVTTNTTT